jgi:hypothetical protein
VGAIAVCVASFGLGQIGPHTDLGLARLALVLSGDPLLILG